MKSPPLKRDRRNQDRLRYLKERDKYIARDAARRARLKAEAEAQRAKETKAAQRKEAKLEQARNRRRRRYAQDFLGFYRDLYASNAVDLVTGRPYADSLGEIHKFVADFLNLTEPKTVRRYSPLAGVMPKDLGLEFAERWLYWPTLKSEPQVQDGPTGPISTMFHDKGWQGVVVRLKGKRKRAMLLPRGHLKSEIITKAHTLWRICRDPSERNLVESLSQKQTRKFVKGIKRPFEQTGSKFHDLYGKLMPQGHDAEEWAADFFRLKCANPRGTDPTVEAVGIGGATTGSHFERILLDDFVTKETTGGVDGATTEETNEKIRLMNGVLDPGSILLDVGTPWEAGDGHSMFIRKDGPFYEDSSFFVATLVDANPEGRIPRDLCLVSRGDPIWPDKFPLYVIQEKRRSMPIDQEYFGQYFCQFYGTSVKLFHPDWIAHYDGEPRDMARRAKCRIFMAVDTASGKVNAIKKGKFDPTGMLVVGQSTLDPTDYYLLDGCKEFIAAEDMGAAIVEMALYWKKFADAHDLEFSVGVEDTAYSTLIKPIVEHELRDRGQEGIFTIVPLLHNNRQKESRIRMLASPHSRGMISLPKKLIKSQKRGPNYDLIEEWKAEFTDYPQVSHEELLDCEAYCFEMAGLRDHPDRPGGGKPPADPSRYDRRDQNAEREVDGIDEQDLLQDLYQETVPRKPVSSDAYSRDEGWEDALG